MLFSKSNTKKLVSKEPTLWDMYQYEVRAVVCVSLFLLVLLSFVSYSPADNTFLSFSTNSSEIKNLVGVFGANLAALLLYCFGSSVYALLAVLLVPAYAFFNRDAQTRERVRLKWLPLLVISGAGLCNVYRFDVTESSYGGIIGQWIGWTLQSSVGLGGSLIVLWTIMWVSIVLAGKISVFAGMLSGLKYLVAGINYLGIKSWHLLKKLFTRNKNTHDGDVQPARKSDDKVLQDAADLVMQTPCEVPLPNKNQENIDDELNFWENLVDQTQVPLSLANVKDEKILDSTSASTTITEAKVPDISAIIKRFADKKIKKTGLWNSVFTKNIFAGQEGAPSPYELVVQMVAARGKGEKKIVSRLYELPNLSLFTANHDENTVKVTQEATECGKKLEEKLHHFGIKGTVTIVQPGPVITMYEYQPDIDSKLSKITSLEDDLAMALAAMSIRIIAPIPGKNAVGFEISNKVRRGVLFSQTVVSDQFQKNSYRLPIALGVDVVGQPVVQDLASMPHLLVGGTTGSGKSVGLNAIIASLLCKRTPADMKLILIDPKRLEFTPYADIPHLLFPIITNPTKATTVLRWVVQEMEDRYERMALAGVRNIDEFQTLLQRGSGDVHGEPLEPMSYLVVVIDELADLMIVAGKEIETYIVRIAQMARAAGIHMIVATQRPSVDVVTGLIKVNFPSRIAFRVSSKVDSRTILDQQGAEKLLGKGDMLFMHSSSSHVARIHGAYVSDQEINQLAGHLRMQQAPKYLDVREVLRHEGNQKDSLEDDLYPQVCDYLKSIDEVSISSLQRKFNIGFNRSARLIEKLELDGSVAPAQGSKPRKVLL